MLYAGYLHVAGDLHWLSSAFYVTLEMKVPLGKAEENSRKRRWIGGGLHGGGSRWLGGFLEESCTWVISMAHAATMMGLLLGILPI